MALPDRTAPGWQPDGTYVPCPECQWAPTLSLAIQMLGTYHFSNCPTVPQVSAECHRGLVEMARAQRRGAAEARDCVIG